MFASLSVYVYFVFLIAAIFLLIKLDKKLKKSGYFLNSEIIQNLKIIDDEIIYSKKNAVLSKIKYDKETSTVLLNLGGTSQDLRVSFNNFKPKIIELTNDTHHEGFMATARTTGYTTNGQFFSGTTQTGNYIPASTTSKSTGYHSLHIKVDFYGLTFRSTEYENRGITSGLNETELYLGKINSNDMLKLKNKFQEWDLMHQSWMINKGNALLESFEEHEQLKFIPLQLAIKSKIAKELKLELEDENQTCYLLAKWNPLAPLTDTLLACDAHNWLEFIDGSIKIHKKTECKFINHSWPDVTTNKLNDFFCLQTKNGFIKLMQFKSAMYCKIPYALLGTLNRNSLLKLEIPSRSSSVKRLSDYEYHNEVIRYFNELSSVN